MAAANISTHSLKDLTDKEIRIDHFIGKQNNTELYEKSAHRRDDHYLFIFQKNGRSKIVVDFKEIDLIGAMILCVSPRQIHFTAAIEHKTEAWLITIDTTNIKDEFKTIFEDHYFFYQPLPVQTLLCGLVPQPMQNLS